MIPDLQLDRGHKVKKGSNYGMESSSVNWLAKRTKRKWIKKVLLKWSKMFSQFLGTKAQLPTRSSNWILSSSHHNKSHCLSQLLIAVRSRPQFFQVIKTGHSLCLELRLRNRLMKRQNRRNKRTKKRNLRPFLSLNLCSKSLNLKKKYKRTTNRKKWMRWNPHLYLNRNLSLPK